MSVFTRIAQSIAQSGPNRLVQSGNALARNVVSGNPTALAAYSKVSGAVSKAKAIQAWVTRISSADAVLRPNKPPVSNRGQINAKAGQRADLSKIRLLGGVTMEDALAVHQAMAGLMLSRSNLWCVTVVDPSPAKGTSSPDKLFMLLATDVSLSPVEITGDAVNIGSAQVDLVNASGRVEVRLSTMDDAAGSIKRWFDGKAAQVVHKDGTFGVPASYTFTLALTHMDPTGQVADRARYSWLVRAGTRETELSRTAQEMETVQLTFVEVDTFVRPAA